MRAIMAFISLVACILNLGACRSKAEYAQIPRQDISMHVEKAEQGQVESARTLARHFLYGKNDLENGKKWLRRAAQLGDEGACVSLQNMGEVAPTECAKTSGKTSGHAEFESHPMQSKTLPI